MTGPVLLAVLDGFGVGDGGPGDATAKAHTPFLDSLRSEHPMALLETSGEAVGLPAGQMGNSEVGHMTMGAGRIILQDMTRIGRALAEGALETNPPIQKCLDAVERSGGTLHLMGLVSDGGVHSHIDHLTVLLRWLGTKQVPVAVHCFLDGRDTPPRSGLGYVRELVPHVERIGGRIATVIGRYYAMDRDKRWDRIGRAYRAIVGREGFEAPSAEAAVERAYERGQGDEFVEPTVVEGGPALADGDAVVFFNFRADRARQLTNALTSARPSDFEGELERGRVPRLASFVCFTEYDREFGLPVAFPDEQPPRILGELISDAGLRQLRIAETEKYAHVTFFFNCGREEPFPGEERCLVPSPRDVPTYDRKPEMSAPELTDEIERRIREDGHAFVLLNYANPDMVGHSGDLEATVKALEAVDRGLARAVAAILDRGGVALVTSDHGNCEQMLDPKTGQPHTAHTTNPVPLHLVSARPEARGLRNGGLADLAPTLLELLELPVPDQMQGASLLTPR